MLRLNLDDFYRHVAFTVFLKQTAFRTFLKVQQWSDVDVEGVKAKLTISMMLSAWSTFSMSKRPSGAATICCWSFWLAAAIWGRKLCRRWRTDTNQTNMSSLWSFAHVHLWSDITGRSLTAASRNSLCLQGPGGGGSGLQEELLTETWKIRTADWIEIEA